MNRLSQLGHLRQAGSRALDPEETRPQVFGGCVDTSSSAGDGVMVEATGMKPVWDAGAAVPLSLKKRTFTQPPAPNAKKVTAPALPHLRWTFTSITHPYLPLFQHPLMPWMRRLQTWALLPFSSVSSIRFHQSGGLFSDLQWMDASQISCM